MSRARVVVRFADVGAAVPTSGLSTTELARHDALVDAADRAAYAAAHLLLRDVVGELVGVAAHEVALEQRCPTCGGPHGRPRVVGHPGVHATLSHTRGAVAAVASSAPCGVDVERVRPGLTAPPDVLTDAEAVWLGARPASTSAADLARLWVRKEALVKAGVTDLDGVGSLDVLADDGPATLAHGFELVTWEGGGAVGAAALSPTRPASPRRRPRGRRTPRAAGRR
ncbi:4'-phosphopantetheinyl transferase superfamily protein [Nocardioides sp. C4-1]|uniref:4'-phosphopantetheinyl transferase family protein n=1 Tax=Nocardioides sp. C4-1 TaxID=3151851 RepID=UPI003267892A